MTGSEWDSRDDPFRLLDALHGRADPAVAADRAQGAGVNRWLQRAAAVV